MTAMRTANTTPATPPAERPPMIQTTEKML